MIFYILFLKHTICHRFRIQNDIFHILLPKQISSLGTGSGPVPTSPPPLFGTRFWQETNRKIAPEELCRGKFPYNRARFGGSPRTNSILLYSRSRRQRNLATLGELGDDAACRSDPTFTRASPGLRSQNNSLKLGLLGLLGLLGFGY